MINFYWNLRPRQLYVLVPLNKVPSVAKKDQLLVCHTDHLNLLYNKNPSQHMVWWRLLMEEDGPTVLHITNKDNTTAAPSFSKQLADIWPI